MKSLQRCLILLFGLCIIGQWVHGEELLVVVHKDNGIEQLTKAQVVDIFMGRYITFPNGQKAKAYDLAPKSNDKAQFYKLLVNRSEAQINAYWARLLFSGRSSPPVTVDSPERLVEALAQSPQGIAYIPSHYMTDKLKVVYRFEAL
ncbi:hypothetical protein BEL05_00835 [Shewanella colwelliana]|uniref:Phosphate ABC transporter substrate-binding protein n=1 Tax=Shewanella colwelliana TaxID=23 RepID=A0A1E5IUQ0_SHECO|nr:hypothetical protein BEL05_00835 [Shewanella colwelliana]